MDVTYILVLVAALFSIWASIRVNTTYNKYEKVRSMSGLTGAMAAERILHSQGIYDVRVEHVSGKLTDHYDPSAKVLRLSDSTYGSSSVAAVGVAAHECGHAVQHAMVGLLFSSALGDTLLMLGIILFSAAVLFQLVTLPVEFDASARAIKLLESNGILGQTELRGTKKVLGAAALTYVAGAATAIIQLARLILIAGGRDRD